MPSNYVIGPGDTLQLQLIGDTGGLYPLVVGRDGEVNLPETRPGRGGRPQLRRREGEDRAARSTSQMIGTRANVSIGALRSIQVFVLGEAVRPGSYTVSGLSTITNALFASGGVREIGSLRKIQLKRDGQLVRQLDLYDMLLRRRHAAATRACCAGDVIFIPPSAPPRRRPAKCAGPRSTN